LLPRQDIRCPKKSLPKEIAAPKIACPKSLAPKKSLPQIDEYICYSKKSALLKEIGVQIDAKEIGAQIDAKEIGTWGPKKSLLQRNRCCPRNRCPQLMPRNLLPKDLLPKEIAQRNCCPEDPKLLQKKLAAQKTFAAQKKSLLSAQRNLLLQKKLLPLLQRNSAQKQSSSLMKFNRVNC